MQQKDYDDFSGGLNLSETPAQFEPGQWSRLDGFIFEGPKRLRSQWPVVSVRKEIAAADGGGEVRPYEVEVVGGVAYCWDRVDGRVLGANADISAYVGTGTELTSIEWNELSPFKYDPDAVIAYTPDVYVTVSEGSKFRGVVDIQPLEVTSKQGVVIGAIGDTYWYLLIDDPTSSWVCYRMDMSAWPHDMTQGEFPTGRVVGSWGDFTIWGDVDWYVDPDTGAVGEPTERYPNGLWFSQPAQWDRYDDQDVVLLPSSGSGRPQVLDMVELQNGLMVFCDRATFFLRGTADNFEIETLTTSGSLVAHRGAALFDPLGVAVWCDAQGRVWMSDGTSVRRLDGGLAASPDGVMDEPSVVTFGEYLLVAREPGDFLYVFQITGPDGGTWTRVKIPTWFGTAASVDPVSVSMRRAAIQGGFVLVQRAGSDTGVSSEDWQHIVWWDIEGLSGLDRGYGHETFSDSFATRVVDLTLGTPVLSGAGHSRTWWHRIGVRLGQVGTLSTILKKVSQWTSGGDVDGRMDGTFEHALTRAAGDLDELVFPGAGFGEDWGVLAGRKHFVVPSIGPSRHLRAEFVFQGDVVLEGVTVWGDGVAPERGRAESQAGTHGTL